MNYKTKLKLFTAVLLAGALLSGCSPRIQTPETTTTNEVTSASVKTDQTAETQAAVPMMPEASPDVSPDVFANFAAVKLDGEPVDGSFIKNSKLTFINVWGTFCPPCLMEMPDLGALSHEYDTKEVQFAGIVLDTVDSGSAYNAGQLDMARNIVEQSGADYVHLLPSPDLDTIYLHKVTTIPTTILVDSEGKILTTAIGMKSKDNWKALIDETLASLP